MSLFEDSPLAHSSDPGRPLAERMRPETLDEYAGQQHILGPGKPLRRQIESDQLSSMIRETDTSSVLKPEQYYKTMEVKGVEEVDGEKAYRLTLLPKDSNNPVDGWYSVESGLLLKNVAVQESPQGEVSVETRYEDYKESEGELKIKQPRKMTMSIAGTKLVMTVDKAEANVEIPAEKFELPPEIKALAEKQKAAPPAGGGDGMGDDGM